MKVEGPKKAGAVGKAKKAAKPSQADGNFEDFMVSGVKPAAATTATQSIAKVDALLAIQGAETATDGPSRGRVIQRADDLLDGLDEIRLKMLQGNLTVGDMVDIADVVASHRENITDPKLTNLMDEIDLRAQVELAKMQVALEKRS